jgi:hypothetical protein
MKKGLLALLCLSLVVALPACKKDEGKATKEAGNKKEMKKKDGAKKEKHHNEKAKKDKKHHEKKSKKGDMKDKEAMPARRASSY